MSPATRHGNLIFTTAMTSRRDGVLQFTSMVKAEDSPESYKEAVRIAASNVLTAVRNTLAYDGANIVRILSFWVYINAKAIRQDKRWRDPYQCQPRRSSV